MGSIWAFTSTITVARGESSLRMRVWETSTGAFTIYPTLCQEEKSKLTITIHTASTRPLEAWSVGVGRADTTAEKAREANATTAAKERILELKECRDVRKRRRCEWMSKKKHRRADGELCGWMNTLYTRMRLQPWPCDHTKEWQT